VTSDFAPDYILQVFLLSAPFSFVVYLQKVMSGLWENFGSKLRESLRDHRGDLVVFSAPIIGTVAYARHYEVTHGLPLANHLSRTHLFGDIHTGAPFEGTFEVP
jgi:hypothetical protein